MGTLSQLGDQLTALLLEGRYQDPETGELLPWAAQVPMHGQAVLSDGTLFVGGVEDGLAAIDAASGAVKWSADVPVWAIAVAGGRVFVGGQFNVAAGEPRRSASRSRCSTPRR